MVRRYISDIHFGHKNILDFDMRPFESVEQMERTMISNWNNAVLKGDITYILGDFCWSPDEKEWSRLLSALNGSKILIAGNHDLKRLPSMTKKLFADIEDYKEIKDGERSVIMCHYPILAYKQSYNPNIFMLYGHVHACTKEALYVNRWIDELRRNYIGTPDNCANLINVGCMLPYMNYAPRTLDELIEASKKLH